MDANAYINKLQKNIDTLHQTHKTLETLYQEIKDFRKKCTDTFNQHYNTVALLKLAQKESKNIWQTDEVKVDKPLLFHQEQMKSIRESGEILEQLMQKSGKISLDFYRVNFPVEFNSLKRKKCSGCQQSTLEFILCPDCQQKACLECWEGNECPFCYPREESDSDDSDE
jgi:hypothetical protein